jgi:hypothetical protein
MTQTVVYIAAILPHLPRRRRRKPPIQTRREERELAFWTIEEILKLAPRAIRILVLGALAVYAIVALVKGELPGTQEVLRMASSLGV